MRAMVFDLMNKKEDAIVNYDSARTAFSNLLHVQPDNSFARLSLAIAYAGLGDKTRALEEIGKTDIGAMNWYGVKHGLEAAYFYILLGDSDSAISSLESCISDPVQPTAAMLRMDPRLDPLRGNPRFGRVIQMAENKYKKQ